MPGGGAEVFSPGVRATIADKKLSGEEYIDVHREAHALGIRSNCTMLYGHVETFADRMAHLAMLRDLQDETGGFLAYIPLAYHPDNNELGETLHRTGTATTGFDDLKNLAVGRLFLDNFDHIKSHWIMVTPFMSQIVAALRRERSRGHGGAREDLSRGRRAHRAGDDARRRFCGSFAARGKCPPSATRSTTSSARSTTSPTPARAPRAAADAA